MLLKFRACAAAVGLSAATLTATASVAEEHTIMILGSSYFPTIAYVDPGDTLLFINASEAVHTVTAADDEWTTGEIAIDGQKVVPVSETMTLAYYGDAEKLVEGTLDFGNAPLD